MPKKKIAIAISEDVLAKLDQLTAAEDVSRSMMVEEAVAQYLTKHGDERDSAEYRRKALAAIDDAKEIAAAYHADPRNANAPSSLEILRAIRAGEADE